VLTVRSGEVEAMRVPVAVGPDAPPPGSERFLKDLVATPDPGGRYGSLAYGLSGATNELAEFRQGRGVVAIHGTDTPDALGRDVPAGAIAVADAEITRMVESLGLPLGTPVTIRP